MTTYILTINDTFRVEADSVESAEIELLTRIGEENFQPNSVSVVDILE